VNGRIVGISGPTVSVALPGLKVYERVTVGHARMAGEVVRLEQDRAIVQVYESTRGLAVGEPAVATGTQFAVKLGPGLLGRIFDGLQRPLESLYAEQGPFIQAGGEHSPAWIARTLRFVPTKKAGESISVGEAAGYVEEGAFQHQLFVNEAGVIATIQAGELDAQAPLLSLRNGREIFAFQEWPVRVPRPYRRKLTRFEPLVTGQRCIDFLFPLARGGCAIFPGGFGTGKTILEQCIAKFAEADIVVYVGCGERGNEMADMLDDFSGLTDPWTKRPLMNRTIVTVNTSNMPVAAREASIYTAVTMAEYYRDMGYNVLLLADSLSRWAEALREISSALEEMPGEEGYPTYLASRIAGFIARAGVVETLSGKAGSLTMILSISPPGGDFTEPVTQACLRTTGSFFMLDTDLAHRRHFPAINWFQSFSLYERDVSAGLDQRFSGEWSALRQQTRACLQMEANLREVVEIVGTEGLQDADRLLMRTTEEIRRNFLMQNAYTEDAFSSPQQTLDRIRGILERHAAASERLKRGEVLDTILKERP
jgi:V/A-type H+/Na+-transporting ATPase subunit A